jgi:ATP-binding cassette subfamily B protein
VFADDSAMTWSKPAVAQPEVPGRIEFRHVTFTYGSAGGDKGKPVLNGIDLVCEPGQTVGIIGSTGSGKSTLVSLIPRFYDADSGQVLVNGQDVRTLDPAELRERIAVVPQKSVLFSGSIKDNIRWGKEQADDAEIEAAAKIAGAHDFIAAFPEGYDTRIGQKGVNLSGGQKQRISIARGLIRKPDILILDDSTSAVDVITEARIMEALRRETRGMTCLLIAQRITSVMDADRILVLEHGEIAGLGTHDELLAGCRVYREIYASQTGKEAVPHVQGE